MAFYDWKGTRSRAYGAGADFVIVVGGRGIGKTYGLRKELVRDYLEKGWEFVELCRYANELPDVENGYFDRMVQLGEFPDHVFKVERHCAYVAEAVEEEEKPIWRKFGEFCALTSQQQLKKHTFSPAVHSVLLDEAVLEKRDIYHRYLPDEFNTFANLLSSILRETVGDQRGCKVYLLGNACDLTNPYLERLLDGLPRFGYSWHRGKSVLLHYVEPTEEDYEKQTGTLVGRMLEGTSESRKMFENVFELADDGFICEKPKAAQFEFGIKCNGRTFGLWQHDGLWYVNKKIPNNTERPIYAFTRQDMTVDHTAVRRSSYRVKRIVSLWYSGSVRFSDHAVLENFLDSCSLFGLR